MNDKISFQSLLDYCQFDYVPQSLETKYESYRCEALTNIIDRKFLAELLIRYDVPQTIANELNNAIEAVEQDHLLLIFTSFLISQLCTVRNCCDTDFYTNMTPACLTQYNDYYSFIVLLACIQPSIELLKLRGVPARYYEEIPHQPLKTQMEKLILHNDVKVHDFPWVLNFYTCSIFLLDRFLFIPHKFEDAFNMYRNSKTQQVIALKFANEHYRRDGQPDGVNGVFDSEQGFITIWQENINHIVAHRINPLGYVERNLTSLDKQHWNIALQPGDTMLALHVPSGSGYNTERLKTSMKLALEFYNTYFPDMNIKGFWSSSWLYDSRLSLVLDAGANIVQVQRQFYLYPTGEDDSMLRYELFGKRDADPVKENFDLKTSLQHMAVKYMSTGARFNTLSMIILKEEVNSIGTSPYITSKDIKQFEKIVDSHLKED